MPILNLSYNPTPEDPFGGQDGLELSGTTLAQHPELDGTAVYDHVIQLAETYTGGFPAEIAPDYDLTKPLTLFGTLQLRVVKSSETGLHSFYYRVTNDEQSTLTVFSVEIYPPWSDYVEVDYRLDGLGSEAPLGVDTGYGQRPIVHFDINVTPGSSSKFLFAIPFASKLPDGSTDFKNSGAKIFLATGGYVLLGITTTEFPIGFTYPAPTVLPEHYRPGGSSSRHPLRKR